MSLKSLKLSKEFKPILASNHPWIYRNHLPKCRFANSEWLKVEAGKTSTIGLYDATSPIAIRLFGCKQVPDRDFVHKRVKQALELRKKIPASTNTYRLIYGEGDFLPGITVDKYERYAVLKTYCSSVKTIVPDVVWSLKKELKLKGILSKTNEGLKVLWGELPPPEITVSENYIKMFANLYKGQKTGLFLDQRENHAFLEKHCGGKIVLDLFSYTGAFSLYAARGGAKHIVSVDSTLAANEDAKKNFALNNFNNKAHEVITADCFKLLEEYIRQGKTFDIVVLDPPSLARAKKSKYAAMRAYQKLNRMALQCVSSGGLLATASCTSQVSPADFKSILAEAALEANAYAQIIHEAGHALDHPIPVSFPEGRYLKFLVVFKL